MRESSGLLAAKTAKNDEFYTQFGDIQKEVNAYLEYNKDVFRGKTVLCRAMILNGAILQSFLRKTLKCLA